MINMKHFASTMVLVLLLGSIATALMPELDTDLVDSLQRKLPEMGDESRVLLEQIGERLQDRSTFSNFPGEPKRSDMVLAMSGLDWLSQGQLLGLVVEPIRTAVQEILRRADRQAEGCNRKGQDSPAFATFGRPSDWLRTQMAGCIRLVPSCWRLRIQRGPEEQKRERGDKKGLGGSGRLPVSFGTFEGRGGVELLERVGLAGRDRRGSVKSAGGQDLHESDQEGQKGSGDQRRPRQALRHLHSFRRGNEDPSLGLRVWPGAERRRPSRVSNHVAEGL